MACNSYALQLSVIIVNYNVKFFLEQCLCSVIKAAKNTETEIFVVDNNSSDGSKEYFKDKFREADFIWNTENIGFAKANNIAVKKATGKYILFLNPDTIVPEDCFEKCISFLESHNDAGALGIKMLDGSGKFLKESKRSFPSPLTSLFKLFGLARLFPHSKTFSKYHLGHLDKNKNNEVNVLAGAFMMIPKKVIEKVGSFDEDFFMYGEDIDLSYRIQKAGYKNYYFAESSILHFKGESTRRGSLNYVKMFYKAMSIFARKHYGGGKAGIFNFLIQAAITLRAFISAAGRFLKWIGMPVIDSFIILFSFWTLKVWWSFYIKREVNYSSNLLEIAFPFFTLIFLAASYYSGLYDNGYRQKRLNHSTLTAFLVLLSVYSLFPESLRFSRGILVFGSLLAFLVMTITRRLLVKWKIIEGLNEEDEHRKTIVAGTVEDHNKIKYLMRSAGIGERILGRTEINEVLAEDAIGNINNINKLVKKYSIREIIFCEGQLSFKKIIEHTAGITKHVRIKLFTTCSQIIIGSDNKNQIGKIISSQKTFNLSAPVNRRNKKLADVLISLAFIITFPVHFFLQKRSLHFFKNVFDVLFYKKTWVGYAIINKDLPLIKNGVLTSTGVPGKLNSLPTESLHASDEWYAVDYDVWDDIKIVWKGYRYLSA